jgi:hypothetical protein
LETGIVFEKILLNWGGLKPSYLGAPESEYLNNENSAEGYIPHSRILYGNTGKTK